MFTAVVSVGASTTIAAMIGNHLTNTAAARIDAIRFDVNQLHRQIDRMTLPEVAQ